MDPAILRKQRVAEWIELHIGARTLTAFAADITAATGWPIDYSRLGRYKNQKLQVGPATVKRFNGYAAKRNLQPVDMGEREAQPSLEERAVIAAEAQATATKDLAAELHAWRTVDRDRIARLERDLTDLRKTVARLVEGALGPGGNGGRTRRPVPRDSAE